MNYLDYIYIITPVLLAIIINVTIYLLGWNSKNNENKLLPPGWMIGTIWIIIFGFLGMFLQIAIKSKDYITIMLLSVLILICLVYPFYTNGLKRNVQSVTYDFIILIYILVMTAVIFYKNRDNNTVYMIPIIIWVSYVNMVDFLTKS